MSQLNHRLRDSVNERRLIRSFTSGFFVYGWLLRVVSVSRLAAIAVFGLYVLFVFPAEAAFPQQADMVQNVEVYPQSVTYGELLEITITGLPSGLPVIPGMVKYQGKPLALPGFEGLEGSRPVSDNQGRVSFTWILTGDMDIGTFALTVDVPPFFKESADLTFRGAILSASVSTAVPNQTVSLVGTGFTGTTRSAMVNRAFLDSVTLGGKVLEPPHTNRLIELDGNGNFFTTITVPTYHSASAGETLSLKVTDSGGRTGVTEINIATPTVTVTPDTGYPGQEIELVGQGFVATNPSLERYNKISVVYRVGLNTEKINETKTIKLLEQAGYLEGFTGRYAVLQPQDPVMLDALKLLDVSPADYVVIKTLQGAYITVNGEPAFGAYFESLTVSDGIVSETGDFRTSFKIPSKSDAPSYNEIGVVQTMGEGITVGFVVPKPRMTISPPRAFPGEQVEIQLDGLNKNYTIPSGSLKIEDSSARLPGYFGLPGEKPKTNSFGSATFNATIPKLSPGQKEVIFTGPAGLKLAGTVTVSQGVLQTAPIQIVPGKTIFVRVQGLSPAPDGYSPQSDSRIITGTGDSVVRVNGDTMDRRHVPYPIAIGKDGQSFFPVTLPANLSSAPDSGVPISATDNALRISAGVAVIKLPSLVVSPNNSLNGSKVLLTGSDFVSSRCSIGRCYQIDITYSGQMIKTVYPDAFGNFRTQITVPLGARSGMDHQIKSKVKLLEIQAESVHTIPPAELKITPGAVKAGERIIISGLGFPSNYPIQSVYIGARRIIPPLASTDPTGKFEISIAVPEDITKGKRSITVGTTNFALRSTFDVIGD